ncbi:MAG: M14 family zinc carboxypeptidase, partial [Pseudobdellovibrionaceae bacterium]
IHLLGKSQNAEFEFPLVGFSFGSKSPDAPVLGLFGGVHGLERIGAQVVLSLLKSFTELLLWDSTTQTALEKIRVVFFPLINPIGMMNKTRCNPAGVDLMRNAPIEAEGKANFLLGGHRLSPKLPWYRGQQGVLEPESKAVIDFCKQEFFSAPAAISMDFHSGFGAQDQIWFPYAKTAKPFPDLAQMKALEESFERTHPHHFYKIEPQALNYTTHGDLWDYIYDQYRTQNNGTYLALALEMGSWLWVRKNPLQIFSSLGPFNPIKPHRHKRILRRHMTLFDFLIRTTLSHQGWSELNPEQKNKFQVRAFEKWYKGSR